MSGWQLNRRLKRSSYFNRVYKKNLFHGNESLSGEGSSLQATAVLRREIPLLLEQFLIRTVLDVPCGDLSWMKEILHIPDSYTGADIAKAAIKSNKRQFKNHNFIVMDVVKETPHTYDLIISRDLLVHLPLSECLQVLANFCRSNSRYLLTTSFLDRITNEDISYSTDIVQWRPLNLSIEPFNLPKPLAVIVEGCIEGNRQFLDKSMALYDLSEIRKVLSVESKSNSS